jgi:hypothetical protein
MSEYWEGERCWVGLGAGCGLSTSESDFVMDCNLQSPTSHVTIKFEEPITSRVLFNLSAPQSLIVQVRRTGSSNHFII